MSVAPLFSLDRVEVGPSDLAPQLPTVARLLRRLPGPDRPDYALAALRRPLRLRTTAEHLAAAGVDVARVDASTVTVHPDGTVDALVYGIVVAPRVVGDALGPTMSGLPVALACVLDTSQMTDQSVTFSKVLYTAVVEVSAVAAPHG